MVNETRAKGNVHGVDIRENGIAKPRFLDSRRGGGGLCRSEKQVDRVGVLIERLRNIEKRYLDKVYLGNML